MAEINITTTTQPRSKKTQTQTQTQPRCVRMLLRMTITCKTCRRNIYEGARFNTHKEKVSGQAYLGIEVFRYIFRCPCCSADISIKTDPQNSELVVESGAFPLPRQAEVQQGAEF